MHRGVASQTEHRRGLVLGLTLAEALLLLLFLLLLALGSVLADLQRELSVERQKEAEARAKFDELVRSLAADKGDRNQIDALAKTGAELRIEIESTRLEMRKRESELKKYEAYEALIGEAIAINRSDPPAALRRGLDLVKREGSLVTPKDLPSSKEKPNIAYAPPKAGPYGHNWPPIIRLSDAEGYYFRSGSADLSSDFKSRLSGQIVTALLETITAYQVDVVEVIGHTDEQPLAARASNLDRAASAYLAGTSDEALISADNAGLGYARAVSVVRALRGDARLRRVSILPLSGAQLIDLGDRISTDAALAPAEVRRRIEIRVRRSDTATSSISPAAPERKSPQQPANR